MCASLWYHHGPLLAGAPGIAPNRQRRYRLVHFTGIRAQTVECGCRVWLTPPPFDHSKLMIVDGGWSFIGSSNFDPRSLRLNFELNVECYCAKLSSELEAHIEGKLAKAHQLTLREVDARPMLIKLRDGVARLLTPYL